MVQINRELRIPAALGARESAVTRLLQRGKSLARAGRIAGAVDDFEAALASANPKRDARLCADALDWLAWLAWIDLDGERTSAYARRMLTLELPTTSLAAFRRCIRQATQTLQLGDALGALALLEEAEQAGRDADLDAFTAYLCVKADVYAALGETDTALGHAQLAVDLAEKRSDRYQRWRRLEYFGYIKYKNGALQDALSTYLRAEQVARGAGLTWEVPFTRVRAAWIAMLLGRLPQAHLLIASCFEFDETVRWMVVTRAWVGLTIGLAVGDDRLVERCSDASYLATALASGDSYTLGRTAAAFHEYYIDRGDGEAATRLLALAVDKLRSPDCAWPLFEAIATYGDAKLCERATTLLAAFPDGYRMARGHRLLFAAVTAAREGDNDAAERLASQAQLAFEESEHHYHAARCIELAGRRSEAHQRYTQLGAVRDAHRTAVTRSRRGRPRGSYEVGRQRREILALVLAGATTKTIAERLGISIRTVKSRVAEIFELQDVSNRAELRALTRKCGTR